MLETGEEWDHGNDWNKRADDVPSIDLKGYVIVPPISPWDEKHRDAIQLDHAKQTFDTTPGETWSLQCRRGLDIIDPIEMSTRVQYWHDRGYRIRDATLTIHKGNSDEA